MSTALAYGRSTGQTEGLHTGHHTHLTQGVQVSNRGTTFHEDGRMIALINSQKTIASKAWVLGLKEARTYADTNPSARSGGGEWTTEDLLFTQEFFEGFNSYGQEVRRKEPTHALIEGHVMVVNQAALFLEKKGFSQDEAVEYLWSLRRVMLV